MALNPETQVCLSELVSQDCEVEAKVKVRDLGEGWRDGLADKSTGCSFRGPGFSSQHPQEGP